MIKRVFFKDNEKLNFKFVQNEEDFIVEELPIDFTNKGNFLILKIRKRGLSTWDLIEKLASLLNIYINEIGYAGLKDKNATTVQYISIPKKYSKSLKQIKHKKFDILKTNLHSSKLSIGDLKGNRFKINLGEVCSKQIGQIEKRIKEILKLGMPNYFGYQRFGRDVQENLQKAKDIAYGETIIKDKKLSKLLVAAYQSSYFNEWLAKRVALSSTEFLLKEGDLFINHLNKKLFTPKQINDKIKGDILSNKISPTGLLPGRKVFRSSKDARILEEKYDDLLIQEKGYRREAIVFPKDVTCKYKKDESICSLEFNLPKGSYATVFIENIANKNFA